MRTRALLALGLALVAPAGLAAQWSVALEATASYYDGASRDTAADPISVRPHHATSFGLRLERCFGQVGVGVTAALAGPDVIAENSSAGAVVKDALGLFEIAPEATVLVGRTQSGVAVRFHAGPLLDVWTPEGADARTRVGGHAGLALEWPLSTRFAGSVRAGVALTSSLFNEGELPDGFELRAMWRRSVSLAVRYRL
jgi:hypothetical protein